MFIRVWLIARREYLERVRTRSFVIITILIPLLMGGLILGSTILGSKVQPDRQIAVVSSDTDLALDLQSELDREQRRQDSSAIAAATVPNQPRPAPLKKHPRILVDVMSPDPTVQGELNSEIESGDIEGYLWITPATSPGGRPSFSLTAKSAKDSELQATLSGALNQVLLREQLAHRGLVATEMDTLLQPVKVETRVNAKHPDHISAMVSVSVLFFIMYLVIMLYGMNVARSIIEEKTSRIFEVLLATVRPEAMMAGKILGVGAVGLTQVGIWLSVAVLLGVSTSGFHIAGENVHIALTASQVIFFLIYFVMGYLFYSAIAAALGAMTNSEQELQQLNMFLMSPLIVCFFMLGPLITSPDSTMSRVLALIPPFTPLMMYTRISLGHPSIWEIALSMVLLSLSIAGLVWFTSRIYRVGVLMYGKRPNPSEILRWLKYS